MPRAYPATIAEAMERNPAPWRTKDEGDGMSSIRDARGGLVTFPIATGLALLIIEAVHEWVAGLATTRPGDLCPGKGSNRGAGGGSGSSLRGFVERDPLVGGRW